MRIDFFARRTHYIDHLAPIWRAMLEERGSFFVPEGLVEYAARRCEGDLTPRPPSLVGKGEHGQAGIVALKSTSRLDPLNVAPDGKTPLLTAAYGDMALACARNMARPMILMEHGVGIVFRHPGYAGGLGLRKHVSLFLAPNERVRALTAGSLPEARQAVVGTPKLDSVGGWRLGVGGGKRKEERGKPVVCISFHWDGKAVAAEAGNAWKHYRDALPELARQEDFTLIGHGHPRVLETLRPHYERMGIEVVSDFQEVMERADVYVNDCSSTLYEFLVTGKPVIILNAPWFRKDVKWGIRFWEYTDVGPMVEGPGELGAVISEQLSVSSEQYREARERAVRELFPYLGRAAERAAEVLRGWMVEGELVGRLEAIA